jgi:hypothetical protein
MWQIISPSVRETAALEDPGHSVSVEFPASLMTSYRSERSSIGSFVGQVKATGFQIGPSRESLLSLGVPGN